MSIFPINPHEIDERRNTIGMYVFINKPGLMMLTVFSKDEAYRNCSPFLDCIGELTKRVPQCSHGFMDITHNPDLIDRFERTNMPITYLPFIVLYYDGVPYARYEGPPDVQQMVAFIQNTYQNMQMQSLNQNQEKMTPKHNSVRGKKKYLVRNEDVFMKQSH